MSLSSSFKLIEVVLGYKIYLYFLLFIYFNFLHLARITWFLFLWSCIDVIGCSFAVPHEQITFRIMGWLSKIFKGSTLKISEGHCDEKYGEDSSSYAPSCSRVISYILVFQFSTIITLVWSEKYVFTNFGKNESWI